MPAKDLVHDLVKTALENDGWLITHDPYFMPVGKERSFIDLGAEKILAATFFLEAPIKKVWELYQVNVLVFDETKQTIIKWIQ